MAKNDQPAKVKKQGRLKLLWQNYTMSRELDPAITWWMLGAFAVVGGAMFALSYFTGGRILWLSIVLGVVGGILAALIVMARRSQRAAIANIEGEPGAAVRVLSLLRRGWKVDQVVGFTKQQDLVHRVIGPPGVILIGEGNPNRLRQVMSSSRKRHERVLEGVTVSELIVGRDPGQVPLDKLVKHVSKLPKTLKPAQMTDVIQRLKAIDAQSGGLPMPKGPVPTSMKGMRSAQRGR